MAHHENVQQKLFNEIALYIEKNDETVSCEQLHSLKYMDMVINETLRFYPAAALIARYIDRDLELSIKFYIYSFI